MRLRHNPNAVLELQKYEDIAIFKPQMHKGRWKDFFGNSNPLYIELGMGRGQFITTHADKHPDINYLGFEKKNEVLRQALHKVLDKELNNIALIPFNITYIDEVFAQEEVDVIYINFCDPWPKDRHAKRRLTHKNFLNVYKKLLTKNGHIEFKTDNRELFDFSLEEFQLCGFELYDVTFDLWGDKDETNVPTEYEQKFASMGVSINRLKARLP